MNDQYSQYMYERNISGSGNASSCISALKLLDEILKKDQLFGLNDFWSIDSISDIENLYQYALQYQRIEGGAFRKPEYAQSYGKNGWFSSALKSYKEFLVYYHHEQQLWNLVGEADVDPEELSKRLVAQEVESIEELVEGEIDFSTEEGKEVLRETKQRVNQDRFRKMILWQYGTSCCVTGLNVPQVLRASHIVAWKDDKKNRLNPANGLCLSATYDAAFDRHLISFDEDCRMIFSTDLKDYCSNAAFKTQFAAYEGEPITQPKRFSPDQTFLEKHRSKMP